MNKLLVALVLTFGVGCASGTAPQAQSPAEAAPAPSDTAQPSATESTRAPAPAKVPDPPALCQAFVARAPASCATGNTLDLLAQAVSEADANQRDARLACLERDPSVAAGVMRALRAELAPESCADALVAPYLDAHPQLTPSIEQALLGLLVAGKLSRLAVDPPLPAAPIDKQKFLAFFDAELKPWLLGQAAAIGELSLAGSRLAGYGMAVAAVAAGLADLRFVDLARELPLPDEMKKDKEIHEVYYAALDEALESRKQRGRDAALVGLRLFGELGALHDARIDKARALLAKLYSGARVDALDRLLVPALPPAKLDTTTRKLAAHLPTFYAVIALREADVTDADTLRAFLERGVPGPHRQQLEAQKARGKLSPRTEALYARALFASGQRYFRAGDFKLAADFAAKGQSDDDRLVRALSLALAAGPADTTELMAKGLPPSGLGAVTELDAIGKSKAATAGMASFDAAYVLELVPRREDPAFWQDLAARYDRAAKLLGDPAQKQLAAERATAARATAQAIGGAAQRGAP